MPLSEALSCTALPGAQACFGTLDSELLAAADELGWLAAPAAGPPKGYYFDELIASDVEVTNFRGIFNDHISAHVMAFALCFARGMHAYFRDQYDGQWRKGGEMRPATHLAESTALIIGVGGIGGATAVHCQHFGMRVIGVDPRVGEAPEGVDVLHRPDALSGLLPQADFVILTAPQTPSTEGMFTSSLFGQMKPSAFFINIGRVLTSPCPISTPPCARGRSQGPRSTCLRRNLCQLGIRCGPRPTFS